MYSSHNEGKSVVTERFIRTLKNKIYKYMTSISKNVFNDELDYIINKYNNTCHNTIKMKPVDIKLNTHIDSSKGVNNKDPKFKIGDIVRISKRKMFQNRLKKLLCLKKLETLCLGHLLLVILKTKNLLEHFTKSNCKKRIKKSLELKN